LTASLKQSPTRDGIKLQLIQVAQKPFCGKGKSFRSYCYQSTCFRCHHFLNIAYFRPKPSNNKRSKSQFKGITFFIIAFFFGKESNVLLLVTVVGYLNIDILCNHVQFQSTKINYQKTSKRSKSQFKGIGFHNYLRSTTE
jgi:hypothetical protein